MFPTETHEQAKSGASSDSMARRNVHSDIRFSKDAGETSLGGKSGGDGAVGTPGPIPNPEVKHRSGEGIPGRGENSAPPGFFLLWAPKGVYFVYNGSYDNHKIDYAPQRDGGA